MEALIVEGCRRGDRAAQRALYELTSDRIYRLLLRMLRNADDAADVMQDTYIRVFERIDQFHEGAGISTWVYRIAVNEALQFLRKSRRRAKLAESNPAAPIAGNDASTLQVELRDALDRLPDDDRILLVMRYYEGLNYADMAQILNKPAGTIASGLSRARERLREVLEEPPKIGSQAEESGRSYHPKE